MLRTDILTQVLPEGVKAAGGVEAAVQVILKQEVDRSNVRELASVDLPAHVVFAQKLSKLSGTQRRPEPVPFVVMAYEESKIAVRGLVAGSPKRNVAQRRTRRGAICGQVHRISGIIAGLLTGILARRLRILDLHDGSVWKMRRLVHESLRHQRCPVLKKGSADGSSHIGRHRAPGIALQEVLNAKSSEGAPVGVDKVVAGQHLRVARLRKDSHVDGGFFLGLRVIGYVACDHELQARESFDMLAHHGPRLPLDHCGLFGDVQAREVEVELGLPTALCGEANYYVLALSDLCHPRRIFVTYLWS